MLTSHRQLWEYLFSVISQLSLPYAARKPTTSKREIKEMWMRRWQQNSNAANTFYCCKGWCRWGGGIIDRGPAWSRMQAPGAFLYKEAGREESFVSQACHTEIGWGGTERKCMLMCDPWTSLDDTRESGPVNDEHVMFATSWLFVFCLLL